MSIKGIEKLTKNELICLAYILGINGKEIFGNDETLRLRKNGLIRLIRKTILTVHQKVIVANYLHVLLDLKEDRKNG